jgi:S-adenosylmethionine uptake transporter
MDALMKGAAIAVGVFTALLWRNVLGAALTLAAWWAAERLKGRGSSGRAGDAAGACRACRAGLRDGQPVLLGLVRTPMAVGMALSFIAPLIALYLSALFLGEPITRRALGASLIALLGVGVVAPGGWARGWPIAGVAAGAGGDPDLGGALCGQSGAAAPSGAARRAGEIAFFKGCSSLCTCCRCRPGWG